MAAELMRFIRRKTDSQSAKIEDILTGITAGSDVPLEHIASAAGASTRMVERIARQTANLTIVDDHVHKEGKTVRTNPRALRRGAAPQSEFTIHRKERSATRLRNSRNAKQNSGDQ